MNVKLNLDSDNKDGFWVKYWMEYGRGSTTRTETYEFLKYADGYTEEDKKNEDFLKILAQEWCQKDHMGWSFDSYHYGFEVVEKPPEEWISDELIRSSDKMVELSGHILRLAEYRKL